MGCNENTQTSKIKYFSAHYCFLQPAECHCPMCIKFHYQYTLIPDKVQLICAYLSHLCYLLCTSLLLYEVLRIHLEFLPHGYTSSNTHVINVSFLQPAYSIIANVCCHINGGLLFESRVHCSCWKSFNSMDPLNAEVSCNL